MKKELLYLPFLSLLFLAPASASGETAWTEKKLGKIILRADKAARQKHWSRAIRHGEEMLDGAEVLARQNEARYINQLKTLNEYYDAADRLEEVADRVLKAYELSKMHLGMAHQTTVTSRRLYYKLLISRKNYAGAIPLVQEKIAVLPQSREGGIKRLHYLKQLYSLYRMTGQLAKEEKSLLDYLALDRRLFQTPDADNIKVILNLANNYCRQNKQAAFDTLMKIHGLDYIC